ncbi:MAG: hypothetical protein HQL63_11360 [Magnetococcales bacterium]|nr:hypothetical protein [Magnetococcales bacterium]MBF0322604.1 hypothetical protein [Magnetococcales bacterium]
MSSQEFLSLDNRFYIIALVLLLARLRRVSFGNRFLVALVNLFGTLLHELAHYLVGLLLLAKPSRISLWPQQTPNGLTLGSVTFSNLRFFNTIPTALAPMLLFYLAYQVDQRFFSLLPDTTPNFLLYLLSMTLLLENAIPSTTDIKVAFGHIGGVLLYGGGGFVYLFWERLAPEWVGWVEQVL